ncbi:unnamed protein product, partial [Scytosiphon promiscuus]
MTFLGAMLSLLLPRSAWRVIQRRSRTGWRQDQFLQNTEEHPEEDSASCSGRTEGGEGNRGRSVDAAEPAAVGSDAAGPRQASSRRTGNDGTVGCGGEGKSDGG